MGVDIKMFEYLCNDISQSSKIKYKYHIIVKTKEIKKGRKDMSAESVKPLITSRLASGEESELTSGRGVLSIHTIGTGGEVMSLFLLSTPHKRVIHVVCELT